MPDQKTMQTSCLGGFSIMWVPKLLLTPVKIRIFGPSTAKFGIFAQILAFLAHMIPCQTKKQCEQGALVSFPLLPKLLIPLVKIRIFGPKTAKFGPEYAFLVILIHLVLCPTKKTI